MISLDIASTIPYDNKEVIIKPTNKGEIMIDYKFQDGDYFVWNKLSDWQKEYLLDNLPLIGSKYKTKESLDCGYADAILYKQKWLFGNKVGFGTSSKYDGYCTNELSFNNLYKSSHPSWVTFNASADMLGCCNLVDGKDYQVEGVSSCGNSYLILDETGRDVMYHKSFFDKTESHKYSECSVCNTSEEDERGFEGLVYVPPEKDSYIKLNTLSQEQKEFLTDNLIFWRCCTNKQLKEDTHWGLVYLHDVKYWVTAGYHCTAESLYCKETHFNNIFIYKD